MVLFFPIYLIYSFKIKQSKTFCIYMLINKSKLIEDFGPLLSGELLPETI